MACTISYQKEKRGWLDKVSIPCYSLGEELISSISHGIGALCGIAGLCLCLVKAFTEGSMCGVVSSWVYGLSLVLLYTMSCVYHGLKPNNAKKILRVFDHCTIFLLIAGTYTPFTLVSLRGTVGWTLFGVIWGTAVLGIVLNAIDVERFQVLSMVCYLTMGWAIVFAFRPLARVIPAEGMRLLLLGGLAYTLGAVLYGIGGKVKYMHSIWHFFVLAGSVFHFFVIYWYVL